MRLIYRRVERRRPGQAVDLVARRRDHALNAEIGAGLEDIEGPGCIVGVRAGVGHVAWIGPGAHVHHGLTTRQRAVDLAGVGQIHPHWRVQDVEL